MELSHVNNDGKASMVDISNKTTVKRKAKACGKIFMWPETLDLINQNLIKKGDVLSTARIAGIMAAKKTSELIPLCHNISLDHIEINFESLENCMKIEAIVTTIDKTGVEMEALTAVSVAALTIYDMCKAVDKQMLRGDIYLVEKTKRPYE